MAVTTRLWSARRLLLRDALVPGWPPGRRPLARATTLQETLQNTALFVGPLAAGLLIAAVTEPDRRRRCCRSGRADRGRVPADRQHRLLLAHPLVPAMRLVDAPGPDPATGP